MSTDDTTPAVPAAAPPPPSASSTTGAKSVVSLEPVAANAAESSSADESDGAEAMEMRKRRRRRKVIFEWQCVNPVCGNHHVGKAGLVSARRFHSEYFGVGDNEDGNGKIKKRKICLDCKEEADEARDDMVIKLKVGVEESDGKSCLPARMPLPKDMVTLDDSDQELQTDTSSESEVEFDAADIDLAGEGAGGDVVNNFLKSTFNMYDLKNQVDMAMQEVDERLKSHEPDFDETDAAFDDLEKQVDSLRLELYEKFRPRLQHKEPVDLNNVEERRYMAAKRTTQIGAAAAGAGPNAPIMPSLLSHPLATKLPPMGDLQRGPLIVGQSAYAMRGSILNVWKLGAVIEISALPSESSEQTYKLRFEVRSGTGKLEGTQVKSLSPKHLAYPDPPTVRIPVGTRIIAIYEDLDTAHGSTTDFYSGVVAEPPKGMNRFRYLVFFDDGYASYIEHKNVRVVCQQSTEVWEDVHQNSREFIKKYLQQYPERPMVRMNKGQIIRTEWDGKWWITRVIDVDASLVKLEFTNNSDKRKELVYRGSTRLGPLYMEMQQRQKQKDGGGGGGGGGRRHGNYQRNTPYVEYTRQTDFNGDEEPKRAVAKKSTSAQRAQREAAFNELTQPPKERFEYKGETFKAEIEIVQGKPFVKHQCSPSCISEEKYRYDEEEMRRKMTKDQATTNPLLLPIMHGWKRQLTKHRNSSKRTVFYVAPCGRRLRNLEETHRYLRVIGSNLEIDFFNFEYFVHVYNEWKSEKEVNFIKDISYGKENVLVSCVNSLDNAFPEYVDYSRVRLPQANVEINTDEEFLVCCDCTDDCQNKEKCACWQMTIQNTAASPDGVVDPNAGYVYRRLTQVVSTGIFECNRNCKCKDTCLNRVAQKPLRSKLQVFRTEKRGWGIRTLADIAQGAFVCIYVGKLFTNEEANEEGQNYGDEYFAELDFIETVENRKEGYESDVSFDGDDDDCQVLSPYGSESAPSTEDEDPRDIKKVSDAADAEIILRGVAPSVDASDRKTRSRNKPKKYKDGEDGDADDGGSDTEGKTREVRGHDATAMNEPSGGAEGGEKPKKEKHTSARKFFGEEEDVYIMDAKQIGNIGRYLNHSCKPNMFVQNCFVDTHDLRFPWVSFFSLEHIRAGSELCWDYCYIVDQVKGKEIYCQCGTDYCRGRLL